MTWIPRLLFVMTVTSAAILALAVVVAPRLDEVPPWLAGYEQLLAVFAHDALVRRTALASAFGLLVTAFVFFRPTKQTGAKKQNLPPGNFAGA